MTSRLAKHLFMLIDQVLWGVYTIHTLDAQYDLLHDLLHDLLQSIHVTLVATRAPPM